MAPANQGFLTVDRDSLAGGMPRVIEESAKVKSKQRIVNCGRPARQTELLIVDPATRRETGSRVIGEIWLRGSSVTDGYWNRDDENSKKFHATLADGRDRLLSYR